MMIENFPNFILIIFTVILSNSVDLTLQNQNGIKMYHFDKVQLRLGRSIDNNREAPCLFDIENGAQVCNCGYGDEEMYLPKMGGNIFQVNALNCKRLRVKSETFSELSSISKITFTNIEDLILESNALRFPLRMPSNRVQLEFTNTIIEELPSHVISGNVDVINFEKCKIGIVRAFAITGLIEKSFRLSISNSVLNRIEPQALKKFSVDQLIIQNCEFTSFVPSRSMYDLEINDIFSIQNSNFTGLFSGAFMLKEVKIFRLQNNQIDELNGSSFQMEIREGISIENNRINSMSSSAFESITVDSNYFSRHSEPLELQFLANTVDIIDRPISIDFSTLFKIKISKLYFIYPIECSNITNLNRNDFFKTNSENIYFKFHGTLNNTIDADAYHAYSYILHSACVEESYLLYIIIGVVILICIVAAVLILLLILYMRKRKAQQLNIVQPEGRTYRETQIIMQIENAGLLKTDL